MPDWFPDKVSADWKLFGLFSVYDSWRVGKQGSFGTSLTKNDSHRKFILNR